MPDLSLIALHLLATLVFLTGCEHPFLTPKLLGWGLLVVYLVWRRGCRPSLAGGLLLSWPLLTGLWSGHSWDWMLNLGLPLLAGCALWLAPLVESEREAVSRSLVWGACLTTLYLLVQRLGLDPLRWEPGPAGSCFGNPNFCADYLLLALGLGRFTPGRWGWAARALILLGILLCQSRGVWLATAVLLLVRTGPPWRARLAALLLLAGLAAALTWRGEVAQWAHHLRALPDYLEAYQRQPEDIDDRDPWFRGKRASLLNRLPLWANSLDLVAGKPLLGCGVGQFRVTYPRHAQALLPDPNLSDSYRPESPHNLVLELASQGGLPFLLVLSWLAWRWARRLEAGPYRLTLALQAAIAFVSLNYLNPAIVLSLILLRPAPVSETQTWAGRWPRVLASLLPLGLAALLVLDRSALAPAPAWPNTALFPEALAARCYEAGDYGAAWHWQRLALDQDPYGPEVRNNLGLIASMRCANGEDRHWLVIAYAAHRSSLRDFPYYRAAARHLQRLEREFSMPAPPPADFFALLPPP